MTETRVEPIEIKTAEGPRRQDWTFPSSEDCRQCHTAASGGVLGVRANQLNRNFPYPSGVVDNQIRTWGHLGIFDADPTPKVIADLPRLARLDDPDRTIEDRARSYLDANCAHCHRPGGVPAEFDARCSTPRAEQRLIGEPVRIGLGIDGARAIAPNDPWRSAVLTRLLATEPTKMPPLAHSVVDRRGAELIRDWIAGLPGPPVLDPPTIRPGGGDYREPVRVAIEHPDWDATIRYTLDGSAPGKASPAYAGPYEVRASTTIRARVYRPGWTRSVVAQETLIFDE